MHPMTPTFDVDDPVRRFGMWQDNESLDFIIVCRMFCPDSQKYIKQQRAEQIAIILNIEVPRYWGIRGSDIIKIYNHLQRRQDITLNPFRF